MQAIDSPFGALGEGEDGLELWVGQRDLNKSIRENLLHPMLSCQQRGPAHLN